MKLAYSAEMIARACGSAAFANVWAGQTLVLVWFCTVGFSCGHRATEPSGASSESTSNLQIAEPSGLGRPDVRLVAITDLQGRLEPCGCTSRPLGGIDRLAAQLQRLRQDGVPTYFLGAGALLDDPHAGGHGDGASSASADALSEQQAIQRRTLAEILERLDLVMLSDEHPQARFSLGSDRTLVVARSSDAYLQSEHPNEVVVVLGQGERRAQRRLAEHAHADFWLLGDQDRAETSAPAQVGRTTMVGAGRQGQGIAVFELFRIRQTGAWRDLSVWSRQVALDDLRAQESDLRSRLRSWQSQGVTGPEVDAQQQRLTGLVAQMRAVAALPQAALSERVFTVRYQELPFDGAKEASISALMSQADVEINSNA